METCPICCETIVDTTEDAEGQEALFYEGPCQKWLHRWCASVHKDSYAVLTSSEKPFVCPSCSLAEHCRLIKSLAKTVEYLKCEIQELKRSKLRHPRAAPTQTCKKSLTRRLCPRLVGSLQYNLSWWQNSSHYLPLSLWKINPGRLLNLIGETGEIRETRVQMVKLKVTRGQGKLDDHRSTMSHSG